MRKKLLTFVTALMVMLVMAFPAQAAFQDMWAQVYRLTSTTVGETNLTPITTGVTYVVLSAGSDTKETLYVFGDNTFTSLTNPITPTAYAATTGGQVQFRVDPTETTADRYVDLIVVDTAGGYTAVVKNFDKYQHRIVIDELPNVRHHGVMFFNATTTGLIDTGISFLKGTVIDRMQTEVITASAATVAIGTNASTLGDTFKRAENMAATGFVVTSASSEGRGFSSYINLTGAAVTSLINYGYVVTSATTGFSYTASTNGGSTTANANTPSGYIHYWFSRGR